MFVPKGWQLFKAWPVQRDVGASVLEARTQHASRTGTRGNGRFLSRRALLRQLGTVAVLPILGPWSTVRAGAAPVAAPPVTPTPPIFYVSSSGSDRADGLSPETSWATIQKANSSLPNDGSILLFRRGDTFYGELDLPFGCKVGAFDVGDKPILTMFKLLNRAGGWTEHSAGIWKIDLNSPDAYAGYTASNDANIGFLMVDGVVKPALKFALASLNEPWDFYCDIGTHVLYVATPANPTSLAADIKAAPNGNTYGATGRVIYCNSGSNEVRDVHVTGSGGCGIGGTGPDVHIHDCLIDYIGGSELVGYSPRLRYGNGIENWVNVKRWLIEDNEIAQVYDVAWSPQGRAGPTGSWEDLTVRNNYIHDCTQTFEFWSIGAASSAGFKRILVEGNLCERAGYSVFADVRPDQSVRVHLLTYLWETPADITIQNNVFHDSYAAYSFHARATVGFVTRDNTIRLKTGTRMEFQRPETVEDFGAWQKATGREIGSTITILA